MFRECNAHTTSEFTPRESATLLFGTTAATVAVMAGAILWTRSGNALAGAGLITAAIAVVALGFLARQIKPAELQRSYPRVTAAAVAAALLLGVTLLSGISANAQETAYAAGDVVVTSDDLNLRDDASVDATLIDTLPAGTAVVITSDPITVDTEVWYAIESDYGDGYVDGAYLTDPATIPTGTSATINTDALNLRAAAGLDSEVVAELDSGTEITVMSDPTLLDGITWYQVDTAAGSGWVAGEYLQAL